MTRNETLRAQRMLLRMLLRMERAGEREILVLLNRQFRLAAADVQAGNLEFYRKLDQHIPVMRDALLKLYRRIGVGFSADVFRGLEKHVKISISMKSALTDAFWAAFDMWAESTALAKAQSVTGTTKKRLRRVVQNSISEGESMATLAKTILKQTAFNRVYAERIARTETHTAMNNARHEAYRSTRRPWRRTWVAMLGERTRKDHAAANGQQVGMDEPFVVGGEELMYPGDPKGSPDNIINCRCVVVYEPAR